jgi:uncharacterized membrane protein YeaQ/YmgE (transglycosylase-associated protein family)
MFWMIVIGVLIGISTIMVMPERDTIGAIVAIVVGIAGSTVPAVLGSAVGWYRSGDPAGILSSVVGAIVLSCIFLALLMRDLQAAVPPDKHVGR